MRCCVGLALFVGTLAGCVGPERAADARALRSGPTRTTESVVHGARIIVARDAPDEGLVPDLLAALPGAVARAQRWGPLSSATIVVHASAESFLGAVGETGRTALRAFTVEDVVHLRSPRAWGLAGASDGELAEVLGHELVHCATWQRIGDRDAWARRPLPFWFREGMAMEVRDPELDRAIRSRLRAFEKRRKPPAGERTLARAEMLLREHADLAYATAWVAFRALVAGQGDDVVGRILDRVRRGATFPDAFGSETGSSLDAFDAAVRRAIVASP